MVKLREIQLSLVVLIAIAMMVILSIAVLRSCYSGALVSSSRIESLLVPKEMRLLAISFPLSPEEAYYSAGKFEGYYEVIYRAESLPDVYVQKLLDDFISKNELIELDYSYGSWGWYRKMKSRTFDINCNENECGIIKLRIQHSDY